MSYLALSSDLQPCPSEALLSFPTFPRLFQTCERLYLHPDFNKVFRAEQSVLTYLGSETRSTDTNIYYIVTK